MADQATDAKYDAANPSRVEDEFSANEREIYYAQISQFPGQGAPLIVGGAQIRNPNDLERMKHDIYARAQDRYIAALKAKSGYVEKSPTLVAAPQSTTSGSGGLDLTKGTQGATPNATREVIFDRQQGLTPAGRQVIVGEASGFNNPGQRESASIKQTASERQLLAAQQGQRAGIVDALSRPGGPLSDTPAFGQQADTRRGNAIDLFNPANREAIRQNINLGLYGSAGDIFNGKTNPQFTPRYGVSTPSGALPFYVAPAPAPVAEKSDVSTRPFDYTYLSPSYFKSVGEKYKTVAGFLANKAVGAETDRQNATTPGGEANASFRGAFYGYATIGTQAVGTTLQSGGRFLSGVATGAVFRGLELAAAKTAVTRVGARVIGPILGATYVYETTKEVGAGIKAGTTPQQRLLNTGTVVGQSIPEVVGFGVGSKGVRVATGETMEFQASRVTIDLRNVRSNTEPVLDIVRLPQSASTTQSFNMAIGGKPASERSGKMTKGELRERKSVNANMPTYDITVMPNSMSFDLRGKERFDLKKGRVETMNFERQKVDTRTLVNEPGAVGFVKQPESRYDLTSFSGVARGEAPTRIAPSNAPPAPSTDFYKPAKRGSNSPLILGRNDAKPARGRPAPAPDAQVVETLPRIAQGVKTTRKGEVIFTGGRLAFQTAPVAAKLGDSQFSGRDFGGRKQRASSSTQAVYEAVNPAALTPEQYANVQQGGNYGSPQYRRAVALASLYTARENLRRSRVPATQGPRFVTDAKQSGKPMFAQEGKPAFMEKQTPGTDLSYRQEPRSAQALRSGQRDRIAFAYSQLNVQAQAQLSMLDVLSIQKTDLTYEQLTDQALVNDFDHRFKEPGRGGPGRTPGRTPARTTFTPDFNPNPRTTQRENFGSFDLDTPEIVMPGPGMPGFGDASSSLSFDKPGKSGKPKLQYNASLVAQVFNIKGSRRAAAVGAATGLTVRPFIR